MGLRSRRDIAGLCGQGHLLPADAAQGSCAGRGIARGQYQQEGRPRCRRGRTVRWRRRHRIVPGRGRVRVRAIGQPRREFGRRGDGAPAQTQSAASDANATPGVNAAPSSNSFQDALQTQGTAERLLAGRSWPVALGAFFLIGIGLSLLPCTWPMIPILASIIVGQGTQATRSRGLLLSVAYVLGSACVYAVLGVAAGLAGASLTVWLQNPWVLGAFACCWSRSRYRCSVSMSFRCRLHGRAVSTARPARRAAASLPAYSSWVRCRRLLSAPA